MSNINSTVSVDTGQILQGAGKITLDGVDLQSFRDGVVLSYNENMAQTESDYGLGPIDTEVMTTELTVSTVLEQSSARNLCIALGANTSSSSSSSSSILFDFGPEMGITMKELIVTGMSAEDKTKGRRVTFHRVARVGQMSSTFKRGTALLLPVQFKVFLNTDNKYFRIEEPIPLADL